MVWKRWLGKVSNRESNTSNVEKSRELWVWIRVPLSALEQAISALQERIPMLHFLKRRDEAQRDNDAVNEIKKSLREGHDDKSEF